MDRLRVDPATLRDAAFSHISISEKGLKWQLPLNRPEDGVERECRTLQGLTQFRCSLDSSPHGRRGICHPSDRYCAGSPARWWTDVGRPAARSPPGSDARSSMPQRDDVPLMTIDCISSVQSHFKVASLQLKAMRLISEFRI